MILRKRQYVDITKIFQSSWHKLDPKKIRLTEDLRLEYLEFEITQRLKE